MRYTIKISNTDQSATLKFLDDTPSQWLDVTAIFDGDNNQRLYGAEFFLYEEPEINIQSIEKQFSGYKNIELHDELLYIHLRERETSFVRDLGFGRTGSIGLNNHGLLCAVRWLWEEQDAATPFVNAQKALSGLDYEDASPK